MLVHFEMGSQIPNADQLAGEISQVLEQESQWLASSIITTKWLPFFPLIAGCS
jgi:hypothetical protein